MKLTVLPRKKTTAGTETRDDVLSGGARPNRTRPNHTRLILLGILVLISVAFLPQKLTGSLVESTRLDGDSVRKEATLTRGRAEDATVVRSNRDDFNRRNDAAIAKLPGTAELGDLINQVESAVSQAQMNWLSGTPTDALDDVATAATTWGLEVSVQGDERQVQALIDNIEDMPRLVTISSVGVQRTEGGAVIVNLSLRFYALEAS
jgi:Tfp pilus assembly protein PilO